MKPEDQKVIDDYREALRTVHGSDIANFSELQYERGWFYLNVARKYSDGSIGTDTSIFGNIAYRRKQVIKRTENLKSRAKKVEG